MIAQAVRVSARDTVAILAVENPERFDAAFVANFATMDKKFTDTYADARRFRDEDSLGAGLVQIEKLFDVLGTLDGYAKGVDSLAAFGSEGGN